MAVGRARAADPVIEMAADHNGPVLPNGVGLIASEFRASDPTVLDTLTMRPAGAFRTRSAAAAMESWFVTSSWKARAYAPTLFAAVSRGRGCATR